MKRPREVKKRTVNETNTAYNTDCLAYMKSLPDNYFDLAVCDPPYGDANGNGVAGDARGRLPVSKNGRWEKYAKDRDGSSQNVQVERERVTRTGGTWAEKYGKKSSRGT